MNTQIPPQGVSRDTQVALQYDANKKSALIGYLLLIFLGALGAHRFYLGRIGSGIAQLLLFIFSVLLTVVAIGLLGFAVLGVWLFVDLFLIPGMARSYNTRLAARLSGGIA